MTLASEAHIAGHGETVKHSAAIACRGGLSIEELFYADHIMAIARRNSWICSLGNTGMSAGDIADVTKQSKEYVIKVLQERKKYGNPIRTTRYGG